MVQLVLSEVAAAATKQMGLSVSNGPNIWNCPGRPPLPNTPALPIHDVAQQQWLIGYQYLGGGVTTISSGGGGKGGAGSGAMTGWLWTSGAAGASFMFHGPYKLSTAKPYWAMFADAIVNYNKSKVWIPNIDPYELAYPNFTAHIPPHMNNVGKPAGGNEVFCDGSAGWYDFRSMYEFSDWGNSYNFWYQDSSDFEPNLVTALPAMSAINF